MFFERELGDLELQVLADPADQQVLVLSQAPEDASVLQSRPSGQGTGASGFDWTGGGSVRPLAAAGGGDRDSLEFDRGLRPMPEMDGSNLIGRYSNAGFASVADGVMAFF